MAYLKTAEARIGQKGKTAFFGELHAILPGQGTRMGDNPILIINGGTGKEGMDTLVQTSR